MIRLIEVVPEDPTRPLKQVMPGVFASGREMEVGDNFIKEHFPPGVREQIIAAKVAFVERGHFEQMLPSEDQAERIDDNENGD